MAVSSSEMGSTPKVTGSSLPVITARTPGRARAAAMSTCLMRAWAWVLRWKRQCSAFFTLMSSAYSAEPHALRPASVYGLPWPTILNSSPACFAEGSLRTCASTASMIFL